MLILAAVTLIAVGAWAQPPDKNKKPTTDPSEKPRNVRSEAKTVYKEWVDKDVAYIITPEERRAYKALQTDEERENFIENFWRRRDPDPDTEENEYRDQYFERIAYANEHYASGIPGWKTDRGRIYIQWGKPDEIDSHPSGGAYNRPDYEGGGETSTYPFETWFYRHLDNVGDGIEIEFVDPTGTGEYHIARNANEKDALLTIPGAGLTTAEELGMSTKSDRMSGIYNPSSQTYLREQDQPFRRMEIINNLQRPPQVKFGDLQSSLTAGTEVTVLDKDPVDFDMRVDFFRQSDNKVITAFTIQTNNKELSFADVGGLQQATLNIFGRVTAVSGRRSGIFEDSVSATTTAEELASSRVHKSIYQKAIALEPGTYRVDVVVRDVKTGNKGIKNVGFVVPRYDDKKLSTSSLIVASKLRSTTDSDIGAQFVIGKEKVIPNLSGIFQQGEPVGIYLQIYNAGIDQTTLRPAVDVDYVFSKGGKEISKQHEDWVGLSDSGQRLTLARLLPTNNVPPGDYEVKIVIKDHVSGQVLNDEKLTGKFTVTQ
jgi:GWxTD domain-containing protein